MSLKTGEKGVKRLHRHNNKAQIKKRNSGEQLRKGLNGMAYSNKSAVSLFKVLRQDPLEAILVIFGPKALIFFCLKALGKK